MRLPRSPADAAMLLTLLFPLLSAADGGFDCNHIRKDNVKFDFSSLSGPRSVMYSDPSKSAAYLNTTYTIDICRPLKRANGVPEDQQCPSGTRICAIERTVRKDGSDDVFDDAFPIAGRILGGKSMDAKWERLKASKAHADGDKEGLRMELNGGFHQKEGVKRHQKAIIEFICDKDKTGLEGLWDPEDKYEEGGEDEKRKREETDGDEKKQTNRGYDMAKSSLKYINYEADDPDTSRDVLRLEWYTKHACEDQTEKDDAEKKSSWGFFTWFILIAFLSTATYLIFGSWLNYNRYGARGWDLLPHGDAIRDIPYLMKDWTRRVVNTVQGGGSRGGYAAV